MPSADGARRRGPVGGRALLGLAVAAAVASAVAASPVRVASLGGEGRLLLDSTNLFDYPALAGQLAHADIEPFDDWAGAAVPFGRGHAAGLFLNRPDAATRRLSAYVGATGSRLMRSLAPRPWIDALYALRLGPGLALGTALRFDHDLRQRGGDRASASRWEGRLSATVGGGPRQLDATVSLDRVGLVDRSAGARWSQTDGTGLGVDLRARWRLSPSVLLLPSATWRLSSYGLAPETGRESFAQGALAVNARPSATVLGVAGVVVAARAQRADIPGDGSPATVRRSYLLPALVVGAEAQAGALLVRLGLRHESAVREAEGDGIIDREFDGGLTTQIGLGFERGPVVVDGLLVKDFLRDGPDLIGGSPHGGGLLSTLSLLYRFYP